jgi:hypothetical protein
VKAGSKVSRGKVDRGGKRGSYRAVLNVSPEESRRRDATSEARDEIRHLPYIARDVFELLLEERQSIRRRMLADPVFLAESRGFEARLRRLSTLLMGRIWNERWSCRR